MRGLNWCFRVAVGVRFEGSEDAPYINSAIILSLLAINYEPRNAEYSHF